MVTGGIKTLAPFLFSLEKASLQTGTNHCHVEWGIGQKTNLQSKDGQKDEQKGRT